jgi:hypothetical protein
MERKSNTRSQSAARIRVQPERSPITTRQTRILRASTIIEVPERMYDRASLVDLE